MDGSCNQRHTVILFRLVGRRIHFRASYVVTMEALRDGFFSRLRQLQNDNRRRSISPNARCNAIQRWAAIKLYTQNHVSGLLQMPLNPQRTVALGELQSFVDNVLPLMWFGFHDTFAKPLTVKSRTGIHRRRLPQCPSSMLL